MIVFLGGSFPFFHFFETPEFLLHEDGRALPLKGAWCVPGAATLTDSCSVFLGSWKGRLRSLLGAEVVFSRTTGCLCAKDVFFK